MSDYSFDQPTFVTSADALLRVNRVTGSASLDFPSIAAAGDELLTIAVVGVAVGDDAQAFLDAPVSGLLYDAYVSDDDEVTVRATNITAAPIDPAAVTVRVAVWKAAQ